MRDGGLADPDGARERPHAQLTVAGKEPDDHKSDAVPECSEYPGARRRAGIAATIGPGKPPAALRARAIGEARRPPLGPCPTDR
jgi:hypothetical protein